MAKNWYDVKVKAVKPRKLVTVARFRSLVAARTVAVGMNALGFQAIISYQERDCGA